MFKKVLGLMLIVAVVILSVGCSSHADSKKYFVSKTGKIKNPYTMSKKEMDEYSKKINSGVATYKNAYMGQFVKPGTYNFDMELVKKEMEIKPINEDMKSDLFRLENKKKDPAIENLITQTKSRLPEIQGQIEDYLSKYLDKQNIKVHIQIGYVDNVFYSDESPSFFGNGGKDNPILEGQKYISVAFLIPKQGDIPEIYTNLAFTLGDDNKFKLYDNNNSLTGSLKDTIELSWLYKAYKDEVDQYIKGVSDIFKRHGLKLMKDGSNQIFSSALSNGGIGPYYINDGIELDSLNYNQLLPQDQFEKYTEGEFTPTKEELLDMFNHPERYKESNGIPEINLAFSVCPVDESRIVSQEEVQGIYDEIKKLDTPQIYSVFTVHGGFMISKYGLKKDLYGTIYSYSVARNY